MRLPYGIATLASALGIASLILSGAVEARDLPLYALGTAFTVTGAVVAARQPRNTTGWLLLGVGVAAALTVFSGTLADELVGDGGTAGNVVAAYATASWVPMMMPELTFLLLLFPDGRLPPGRRWRWVGRVAGLGLAVLFFAQLVKPGPLEDYPGIDNPLGLATTKGLEGPGFMLTMVAIVGCVAALVMRYRRADGIVREQIKWLAFAGLFAAFVMAVGFALFDLLPDGVIFVAMMSAVTLIPVAAAVAVLRYRLYDIELVINRALVYTALTATLVAAYLLTVLVAQLVLPARSDLGVAVSTLAAAAVFAPARRRIQAVVDRRFFRRRYDAERTLTAFGTRLRDEVDLATLTDDLRGVVADTVQPAHVSLWLRKAAK